MRRLALLLALTMLACDSGREPPEPPVDPAAHAETPESPPTGIGPMHDMYENLEEEVAKLEKKKGAVEERELAGIFKGIEILLTAVDRAIREEARDFVQQRHALARRKQAEIIEERALVWDEIRQIEELLKNKEPPPGFTEAELEDKLGDYRAEAAEIEKRLVDVNRELKRDEDLLKLEVVPPQDETAFTRERETILALKGRAEALSRDR